MKTESQVKADVSASAEVRKSYVKPQVARVALENIVHGAASKAFADAGAGFKF